MVLVGTSITLIQLRDLAKLRGEQEQARQYFIRASTIINARGLTFLENNLNGKGRKHL
jgi:hypothetical protein